MKTLTGLFIEETFRPRVHVHQVISASFPVYSRPPELDVDTCSECSVGHYRARMQQRG